MIHFLENKNGKLIPFAGPRSLCSFQRPHTESLNWYKQYNLKGQTNVCILGAGGGYHLKYLQLLHSNLKITVIDFNEDLLDALELQFKKNNKIEFIFLDPLNGFADFKRVQNYIQDQMPLIMPFRPGWQGKEELFQQLLLKITQREASILKQNWDQTTQDVALNWDLLLEEKNYLTLKNLVQASDSLRSFDEKVLHIFDEIIK
ncbi:MAG: hypothetical protein J0M15_04365 [Deltaproteobacteria bacterium]|nr:hypothetical protein [Deltaproteobacteria bacterium]